MGGMATAVDENTKNVRIEMAVFDQQAIMGRARHYKLVSDASYRFERGVDAGLQRKAMKRLVDLATDWTGGEYQGCSEWGQQAPERHVPLKASLLQRTLGPSIGDPREALESIGASLVDASDSEGEQQTWRVPSWRNDLRIGVDLVEEVARLQSPAFRDALPAAASTATDKNEHRFSIYKHGHRWTEMCSRAVQLGFNEVRNYTFTGSEAVDWTTTDYDVGAPVHLASPMSARMQTLRPNLLVSLLHTASDATRFNSGNVALFETGSVFGIAPQGDAAQSWHDVSHDALVRSGSMQIGDSVVQQQRAGLLVVAGDTFKPWDSANAPYDFFALKSHVMSLLATTAGADITTQKLEDPAEVWHPGQSARLVQGDGKVLAVFGKLHPKLCERFGVDTGVYAAELLVPHAQQPAVTGTNFGVAVVRRDYSFVAPARGASAGSIVDVFYDCADAFPGLAIQATIFDRYSDGDLLSLGVRVEVTDKDTDQQAQGFDTQYPRYFERVCRQLDTLGIHLRE